MSRVIHAELLRLIRRRTVLVIAAGSIVFAVVAALAVFSTAQASGAPSRRSGTTLAALTDHGGGTEAFAVGAAFIGFFVFVTFIAIFASEFSGGTFRASLLRDPHRLRVLIGKLVGILLLAAGALAVAETCTYLISLLVAPTQDVSTTNWHSLDSVGAALRDYATVLGGVAGWAIFGATLAVIFRSVPLAVGVGFAWAGPIENITSQSWQTGYRIFPGQVLASLIQGGTTELPIGRALLTAALYAGLAAVLALVLVSQRDVTT